MTRPAEPTPPASPSTLTITRPDDWHLHVRDGAALAGRACRIRRASSAAR